MISAMQFVVVRDGGKWCIKSRDLERSFADQFAAASAAVELANHMGKNGQAAVVIVELARGRFKTVWIYGRDAYPFRKSSLPRVAAPEVAKRGQPASRGRPAPLPRVAADR